jgi:hypothetical protein
MKFLFNLLSILLLFGLIACSKNDEDELNYSDFDFKISLRSSTNLGELHNDFLKNFFLDYDTTVNYSYDTLFFLAEDYCYDENFSVSNLRYFTDLKNNLQEDLNTIGAQNSIDSLIEMYKGTINDLYNDSIICQNVKLELLKIPNLIQTQSTSISSWDTLQFQTLTVCLNAFDSLYVTQLFSISSYSHSFWKSEYGLLTLTNPHLSDLDSPSAITFILNDVYGAATGFAGFCVAHRDEICGGAWTDAVPESEFYEMCGVTLFSAGASSAGGPLIGRFKRFMNWIN